MINPRFAPVCSRKSWQAAESHLSSSEVNLIGQSWRADMIGQAGTNELPESVKPEVKWQLRTGAYFFFNWEGDLKVCPPVSTYGNSLFNKKKSRNCQKWARILNLIVKKINLVNSDITPLHLKNNKYFLNYYRRRHKSYHFLCEQKPLRTPSFLGSLLTAQPSPSRNRFGQNKTVTSSHSVTSSSHTLPLDSCTWYQNPLFMS